MSWISRLFGASSERARPAPRLPGRKAPSEPTRVDFAEFTPDALALLGQVAFIQLEIFENLSRALSAAPSLAAKEGLTASAAVALRKHHALVELIRDEGADPNEVMAPFAPALEHYREVTAGSDWWEMLVSSYITAGIFDDFFERLAAGLRPGLRSKVIDILREPGAVEIIQALVLDGIAADPLLSHRLALWGRRLVGDTLLVTRSAMHGALDLGAVEPVFTTLIAGHTRRMDALGLTA